MIVTIIIISLAFVWLGYESDWLRVELPIGVISQDKPLAKTIIANGNLPAKELKQYLRKILRTDLELGGLKSRPKALRIGYGVYDVRTIKELVNLIPDDADLHFESYPYKPAYKEYMPDGSFIPHNQTPARLVCEWQNGSKNKWTLNSGFHVWYYAVDDRCPAGDDWTPEKRKAYGIRQPKIATVSSLHNYQDGQPEPTNGISLLAEDLPIFEPQK